MSVDSGPKPARTPPAKKQIPLPVAIALVVVALAALFFTVLKPMLFPPEPESVGIPMPTAPGAPSPMPGPPTDGSVPAPAPGSPPAPAPAAPTPAPPAAAPVPSSAAPSAAPPSATPLPVPQPGEIVVSGVVKSVAPGANQFTIDASSVMLPGKGDLTLSPPRSKVVILTNKTVIKSAGASTAKSAITAGAKVSAVGKNSGEGASLVARRVVL